MTAGHLGRDIGVSQYIFCQGERHPLTVLVSFQGYSLLRHHRMDQGGATLRKLSVSVEKWLFWVMDGRVCPHTNRPCLGEQDRRPPEQGEDISCF